MEIKILRRKEENFDKFVYDAFMRELAKQAESLQSEMGLRTYGDYDMLLW